MAGGALSAQRNASVAARATHGLGATEVVAREPAAHGALHDAVANAVAAAAVVLADVAVAHRGSVDAGRAKDRRGSLRGRSRHL